MSLPLALLNCSIITNFGSYTYDRLSLVEAQGIADTAVNNPEGAKMRGILSAIGHQATASILTDLLEMPVEVNRIPFAQEVGQRAIVLKFNGRSGEGVILTRAEIEAIGYELGLLTRTA